MALRYGAPNKQNPTTFHAGNIRDYSAALYLVHFHGESIKLRHFCGLPVIVMSLMTLFGQEDTFAGQKPRYINIRPFSGDYMA